VERLACKMYEADASDSLPWLRHGWTVRETWLKKAREKLARGDIPVERRDGWRNAWGMITAVRP
jgi:hypothetical protein